MEGLMHIVNMLASNMNNKQLLITKTKSRNPEIEQIANFTQNQTTHKLDLTILQHREAVLHNLQKEQSHSQEMFFQKNITVIFSMEECAFNAKI